MICVSRNHEVSTNCVQFYFRVVDHWNSLPANNTNVFKTDLIDIGSIKVLYMIFDRKLTELKVVVLKFSE